MVQKFLPSVSQGDKRIVLVDGEFAGAINRKPGEGEFRSNLAVGGFAEATTLTVREEEICAVLGPELLDVPRDQLFYSGGGGSVRGQPYRSLGVLVPSGSGSDFLIGGRYFVAGSVELRAKVTKKIGVVGFFDAGSVGIDGFTGGSAESHAGAGLGVRYDTGIGPIRFDLAAPVSGDTGDGVQFYIGLGQAF